MNVSGNTGFARSGGHSRSLLAALLVAAAYYTGGVVGLAVRVPPSGIAILWPPNAILLAALLLSRPRLWPWYALTVLPAHLHVTAVFGADVPVLTAFNQYVGNVMQVVLAALLLRRAGPLPPRLDDFRSAGLFILLAAFVAPAMASAFAAYLHTLTGWASSYALAWEQRLLNNVVSTLTVTPLIVLFATDGIRDLRRASARRIIEPSVLVLALFAVAFAIFGWRSAGHEAMPALLYALLPLLLWAAVRFPPFHLFCCLLVVTAVSLVGAYFGRGPFQTLSRVENVLALHLFLIAISVPLILLSALIQEQARTQRVLVETEKRFSLATAAGAVSVWDWRLPTGEFYLDPSLKTMLGFEDHEIENTLDDWMRHSHPDDNARVMALAEAHRAGESPVFEAEHRAFRKDGTVVWLLSRGVVAEYANGIPARITGTSIDITARRQVEQELRKRSEQIRVLAGRLMSAQEEERRRIARDLHDDLNQKLAALSIEISSLKKHAPAGSDGTRAALTRLQARTADLVDDVRKLSHQIHPSTLEQAGLIPALTSFAAELSRLEGIEIDLTLPDWRPDISRNLATASIA